MQTTNITGASGKVITATASARLPITDYLKLKTRAEQAKKNIGTLLREWITEKLSEESETQHEPAN